MSSFRIFCGLTVAALFCLLPQETFAQWAITERDQTTESIVTFTEPENVIASQPVATSRAVVVARARTRIGYAVSRFRLLPRRGICLGRGCN